MSVPENKTSKLQDGLQPLLQEAVQLVNGQRGLIAACVPESQDMRVDAAYGLERDSAWTTGHISQSLLRRCVNQKRGILTHDAMEDKRFSETTSVILTGLRSAMCEPILVGDDVWGVVYVDNMLQAGAFMQKDLKKLKDFSSKVGKYVAENV